MATYKKERLADLLHSFLASELRLLHQEAFSLVTITEVRPSRDYRAAKIFWTYPGNPESGEKFLSGEPREQLQRGLTSRVPYLKRRIAEELQLRFVPELEFEFDSSAEQGSKIDDLLKKAGY